MIRRFVGALAAALGLLTGLWLLLAPVALGTQPAGLDSDWNDPTITEFTTGAVIAVVGLIGLAAFAMSIRDEVVRRGLAPAPARAETPAETAPAPAAEAPAPAARPSGEGQVADLLAPLVRALADDMGPRATPNGAPRGTGTPNGGEYR